MSLTMHFFITNTPDFESWSLCVSPADDGEVQVSPRMTFPSPLSPAVTAFLCYCFFSTASSTASPIEHHNLPLLLQLTKLHEKLYLKDLRYSLTSANPGCTTHQEATTDSLCINPKALASARKLNLVCVEDLCPPQWEMVHNHHCRPPLPTQFWITVSFSVSASQSREVILLGMSRSETTFSDGYGILCQ